MSVITNRTEVATSKEKRIAMDMLEYVLDKNHPERYIKDSVSLEKSTLTLKNNSFSIRGKNVYVIGAGKSSYQMAKALEDEIGDKIKGGFVNSLEPKSKLKYIKNNVVSHPFPSKATIDATKQIFDIQKKIKKDDVILFLLSGGASSMFALPPDDIAIDDFFRTYEILVRSGIKIDKINSIRKHISQVKGGNISKIFNDQKIFTLLLSDVLSGDVSIVGSGPTDYDKSSFSEVLEIIKENKLKLPDSVMDHIKLGSKGKIDETLKTMPENSRIYLLGDGRNVLESARSFCKTKKLDHTELVTSIDGDALKASKEITKELSKVEKRPLVLIGVGETTTKVPEKGAKGGRNQHLILSLLKELDKLSAPWSVLSFDTDGKDFVEGIGGAIIDHQSRLKLLEQDREKDLDDALKRYASTDLLSSIGATIKSSETGINFCDIFVVVLGIYRVKTTKKASSSKKNPNKSKSTTRRSRKK